MLVEEVTRVCTSFSNMFLLDRPQGGVWGTLLWRKRNRIGQLGHATCNLLILWLGQGSLCQFLTWQNHWQNGRKHRSKCLGREMWQRLLWRLRCRKVALFFFCLAMNQRGGHRHQNLHQKFTQQLHVGVLILLLVLQFANLLFIAASYHIETWFHLAFLLDKQG